MYASPHLNRCEFHKFKSRTYLINFLKNLTYLRRKVTKQIVEYRRKVVYNNTDSRIWLVCQMTRNIVVILCVSFLAISCAKIPNTNQSRSETYEHETTKLELDYGSDFNYTFSNSFLSENLRVNFLNSLNSNSEYKAHRKRLKRVNEEIEKEKSDKGLSLNYGIYLSPFSTSSDNAELVPNTSLEIPFLNSEIKKLRLEELEISRRQETLSLIEFVNQYYNNILLDALRNANEQNKSEILKDTLKTQKEVYAKVEEKFEVQRASKYDLSLVRQSVLRSEIDLQDSLDKLDSISESAYLFYGFRPRIDLNEFHLSSLKDSSSTDLKRNVKRKRLKLSLSALDLQLKALSLNYKPKPSFLLSAETPIDNYGDTSARYSARINLANINWKMNQREFEKQDLSLQRQALQEEFNSQVQKLERQKKENKSRNLALKRRLTSQINLISLLEQKKTSIMDLFLLNRIDINQVKTMDTEILQAKLEELQIRYDLALNALETMNLVPSIEIELKE